MNLKNLTNYKPYSVVASRDPNYADVFFENEGVMTIPKSSASTIFKLLNEAFQNGVQMTLRSGVGTTSDSINLNPQEFYKPKPQQPQEEPVQINSFRKKSKK